MKSNQTWIFLFSILSLLVLAIFSVGWLHPDEHFQILEFARWKMDPSNTAHLPWEFHCQMRPAIQPAMVVALSGLISPMGAGDPFTLALILRILSGILSFTALWRIYRWYVTEISDPILKRQFTLLSFLLWFTLYLAVRFCSETWSGALFVIAFTLPFSGRANGNFRFLATGALLGFSFMIRYQAGFMVAGFMLWLLFIRKEKLLHMVLMVAGLLAAAGAGILVDRWFYGEWVLTAWNYFEQNIVADKVSGFGIHPWYFYFTQLSADLIPPFSFVIILAFLMVFLFRPKDVLTWTLLPFILIHIVIGHKEARFLFPLTWFVPVILMKATDIVSSVYGNNWVRSRISRIFIAAFWVTDIMMLTALFFIPADRQVNLYQWSFRNKGPTTLYYISANPYGRALQVEFYRGKDLTFKHITDVQALDTVKGVCLLAVKTTIPDMSKLKVKKAHLVYSSLPEFVKYFNFNNWLNRTQVWYLYRLE